jgi:hypothetical protein
VRTRVGTHVTVSTIERLPVPKPSVESRAFRNIAALSTHLAAAPDKSAGARLQAAVAHLYGLTCIEFQHVLDTFPLIPADERAAAMNRFMTSSDDDPSQG